MYLNNTYKALLQFHCQNG